MSIKRRKGNKFDLLRGSFIELVDRGYLDCEIAERLGIAQATISLWYRQYPKFKEVVSKIREGRAKHTIESNLFRLANGAESKEEVIEYHEDRVINGIERKVKRTIKKKRAAPNVDALRSLANKYCPDEFEKIDKTEHTHNVRITTSSQSLSDEEKLKLIKEDAKVIETTAKPKDEK
jgi:predicted transcriptional regulator